MLKLIYFIFLLIYNNYTVIMPSTSSTISECNVGKYFVGFCIFIILWLIIINVLFRHTSQHTHRKQYVDADVKKYFEQDEKTDLIGSHIFGFMFTAGSFIAIFSVFYGIQYARESYSGNQTKKA